VRAFFPLIQHSTARQDCAALARSRSPSYHAARLHGCPQSLLARARARARA